MAFPKVKLFSGIVFLLLIILIAFPTKIKAQGLSAGTIIRLREWLAPNTNLSAHISSGEIFSTRPGPDANTYVQCKNADCSSFQMIFINPDGGFGIQGENFWVGSNTTFRYYHGSFDPTQPFDQNLHPLASWLPASMAVGETYSTGPITVVGFQLDDSGNVINQISTPYAGPTGAINMHLNYVGPVDFGNGIKENDVAIFQVVDGPGAGEKFYFRKGVGWIGWENPAAGISNLLDSQLFEFTGLEALKIALGDPSSYTSPGEVFVDNQCSAGGSIPSSGMFRPYPCKNCTLNVPQGTKACADPFSVNARTEWTCGSLERCGDGTWLKYANYGTNFSLDTRDTDVPFAGYHKVVTDQEENSLNLHYYLADYIGGTALYDGKPYDPKKPKQVTKMINEAGVFRKLAPLEIQDEQRADMILSGHNYEVTNGTTTKQMMDWWPEYPLPPKPYPAGHFPPLKSNPLFLPLYSAWLTTEWGRLWQRIPLFTREDSPGKITLTIEHYPGELSSANEAGRNKSSYSAEFPMAFPHLARLHDSSQTLQQMLLPKTHDKEMMPVPIGEEVLGPEPCSSIFGAGIPTALGCMPTTAVGLASWFIQYGSFLAGGIAFLLMGFGAFLLITSSGDQEKVSQGKTIFVAALIGLIFVISSVFILRLIASQILKIPGFTQEVKSPEIQITENKPENLAGKILLAQAKINPQPLFAQKDITNQNPVLLAEGDPSEGSGCFELDIIQNTDGTQANYEVREKLGNDCYYRDIQWEATFEVDGQPAGGCVGSAPVLANPEDEDPPVSDEQTASLKIHCQPTINSQSENVTINFRFTSAGINSNRDEGCQGNQFPSCACTTTFNGDGSMTTNCSVPTGPPAKPDCGNSSNLDPACSGNNPQEDNNPNDPVCCNAAVRVDVNDYRVIGYDSDDAYEKACIDCEPDETPAECSERHAKIHEADMSRKVQVDLKIPYLENIWEDTAEDKWGVFNIFRPADWPAFPDDDALSRIRYTQESPQGLEQWIEWVQKPVWLSPSEGNLYFRYLGGIQQTKKCIAEHFLLPPELQSEINHCQFWDEYLKNQPPPLDPGASDSPEPDRGDDLDLMDCQNKNFEISSEAKQSAIATADNSWPNNLLEERWDDVASQSKNHGWNPACVIALWIEESGGSDFETTGAKYSLGCEAAKSPDPSTNLDQSLECFFSRQDHPYYQGLVPGSRKWWLVYAKGPNHNDVFDGPQANFPKNLYSWYQRLSLIQ